MSENVLFDYGRTARIGLPEAIFCEGKQPETVVDLLARFSTGDFPPVLFTRLAADIFGGASAEIRKCFDYHALSRTAFARTLSSRKGRVAIVSTGTSDSRISWEAARTLTYLGISHTLFEDCGVAGLWRLTERLPAINEHDVLIIVAGLDAALASVLGGLSPKPLIAVPTSVGYGVANAGETALHSMLASCAPGLAVMNIDNGYGAACTAARILSLL